MRACTALWIAAVAASPMAAGAAVQAACHAKSNAVLPTIVELYTSEGCNSCPPADRWLTTLRGRADVIALSFHVDYWDRLGWKDRFASPAHTTRQQQLQRVSGARFIYTPQVIVNGRDWRDWPGALPAGAALAADIVLERSGQRIEAVVTPRDAAPSRLAAYWVAIEDGHVTEVRAGENVGVTLRHDAVVHAYRELPAWSGREPRRFGFDAPVAQQGQPSRIALIVVDAATLQPVGAASLGC